jgi:DNA polymerase III epsilon subunit-like protein
MENNIIILDTETTGCNFNTDDIIQIAWCIYDNNKKLLIERNLYINTDIKINNSHIHQITNNYLIENGIQFNEAINILKTDIKDYNVNLLVCHNVNFDKNMIIHNCRKNNIDESCIVELNTYCTMDKSKKIKGGRWSKLTELHEYLFQEKPENLHNALNDTKATANCYFAMRYLF